MDKSRPALVIAAAYLCGPICILILSWFGALSASLAVLVFAAGFCVSGAQTGLNAFAPGCYPTIARATGVSWMLGMGRFGSIGGSLVGGALLGLGWGFGPILGILAIPAMCAALAIAFTRRGAGRTGGSSSALRNNHPRSGSRCGDHRLPRTLHDRSDSPRGLAQPADRRVQGPVGQLAARGINIGLATRMYFEDEQAANSIDPVLNIIEQLNCRQTLIAARSERNGGVVYTFDIFLQGERETVFFDV